MTILAIESSCDETAAAVTRDDHLLANVIASQQEHLKYGGVVPELASRAHIAKIVPVVEQALQESAIGLDGVDAVAATYGPGLIGSLLVGLTFAKSLAMSRRLPFLGINHIEGHLFSATIEHPELRTPFLCLVVSGGHTILAIVRGVGDYDILGQTIDDAAGEAFDKVAKVLGLPYPGGPSVEKLAAKGDALAIKFPIARLKSGDFDFSFSGLKTAVLYHYRGLPAEQQEQQRADIAASFQKAVIEALARKVKSAVQRYGIEQVAVAGGVAQNKALAQAFSQLAAAAGFAVFFPSAVLCTDNAAMIAKVAAMKFHRGDRSPFSLPAVPNLALTSQASV